MSGEYKYYAFISYSSHDTKWGKRLQRKLENYRMPSTLCREKGWRRKPISPVFFAPTDIQPGGLSEELKSRLRASKNLIVICSPYSAQSQWVGREIEYFHQLGRDNNIHFFIVDGVPGSGDPATECFNPVVKTLGIPEILGANIHERIYPWPWMNRQRACVQLISKLLGVEFDSIWRRHRRRMIARAAVWVVGTVAVVAAMATIWVGNQPFDTKVSLVEHTPVNSDLPPLEDAVVAIALDGETKTDTIRSADDVAAFANIPHRYLGRKVRLTFSCRNYIALDTMVELNREVAVGVSRDRAVYGRIAKRLWDGERFVANTVAIIDGHEIVSDSEGYVRLTLPVDKQRERYIIEIPSRGVTDTVFMPCGPDDIIDLDR